ncbi:hypothetical protein ACFOVU_25955 [Nocardiopsis sediminis]|uniref:SWIM-type domain-containing protein n=1 Tax=Nocardiopsis sediminis TaxID=1778267 RepID=A0ABV8FTF0_9ACTN
MDAEDAGAGIGRRSVVGVLPPARARKLAKVPFVELADGRVQGVVSSGSDIARVYVSSIAAESHDLSCGTNNNRPCGGLYGSSPCKHLRSLLDEAVLQYGVERVAAYLRVGIDADVTSGAALMQRMDTHHGSAPSGVVFSRFLRYLSYLEVPGTTAPLPEMHWFPATGAAR